MRTSIIPHLITLLVAVLAVLAAPAQFVTLEGRQFMVDGQPFYPRVMNYGITFATNVNGTTNPALIYITPDGPYDRLIDDAFECNGQASCEAQLLSHFNKIVSMGFNAVRITGGVPEMFKSGPNAPAMYKLPVRPNTVQWAAKYVIDFDLETPAALAQRYFTLVNGLLDMAEQAGLKVILLSGIELRWSSPYTGPQPTPNLKFLSTDAELYGAMLYRLAFGLKDRTALMAYDVLNEPAWRDGTNIRQTSKSAVCDYTTLWYDNIKAGSQGHHLVTLGGVSMADLGNWDPAVMRLDFYSPHPYIDPVWTDDWNMVNAIERYKAELYWIASKSTMPWLVGETGFCADDQENFQIGTDGSWVLLRPEPEFHQMPYMHGFEPEQAAFAEMSMDLTRAYLGSGYSWWTFQNSKSPPITADPKDYRGNFWGALGYGDGTNPWRNKLVVDEFTDYILPQAPNALPEPPTAYGNWHSLPADVYRHYYAQDQHLHSVPDALVEVQWDYTPMGLGLSKDFWDQAVSDPVGHIVLHRAVNRQGYFSPIPISANAHASAAIGYHTNGATWSNNTIFSFPRELLEYSRSISGEYMLSDPGKDFMAWSELTIADVYILNSGSIQNEVKFSARQFVHVTGEFFAGGASEVHIFNDDTFPDCSGQFLGMVQGTPGISSETKSNGDQEQQMGNIELHFLPRPKSLIAFPNPCIDRFTIKGDSHGALTVVDAQGAIILEDNKLTENHLVDTRQWLAGTYWIRVLGPEGLHTLSITKVR